MLLPLTNAQRCERFGTFKFVPKPSPSNPEAIHILGGWPEANIDTQRCKQIDRVVNFNHKAMQPFMDLMKVWEAKKLLHLVTSFNGSWVPRYKRGRSGGAQNLSNHSWGTAFDICAKEYPLGKVVLIDDPIRQLVPDANALGWFWGGDFKSRPDGMHFEYVGFLGPAAKPDAARALLTQKLTRAEVRHCQVVIGVTADGDNGPKTRARAKEILNWR